MRGKQARWALTGIFLGLGVLLAFVLPAWLVAVLLAIALIVLGIFYLKG